MARRDFTTKQKNEMFDRSGGHCEATGSWYGLPDGQRCGMPLDQGVEFDHIIEDGIGGKPEIENGAAVCPACHRHKTSNRSAPVVAKMKRQRNKNRGIRKKSKWPNRKWKRKIDGTVVRRS